MKMWLELLVEWLKDGVPVSSERKIEFCKNEWCPAVCAQLSLLKLRNCGILGREYFAGLV
jgi:hypothetical protein